MSVCIMGQRAVVAGTISGQRKAGGFARNAVSVERFRDQMKSCLGRPSPSVVPCTIALLHHFLPLLTSQANGPPRMSVEQKQEEKVRLLIAAIMETEHSFYFLLVPFSC